jgi:hypothetical protein
MSDDTEKALRHQGAVAHFRAAVAEGKDWPTAMLEAMAMWELPDETFQGRRYTYFFAGEAFDWLTLAERLFLEVEDLVPPHEIEHLLFDGVFPEPIEEDRIKDLLGVDKYRGYLNYYYGVVVERAIQLASELEVEKRKASNGVVDSGDNTDEAFMKIYRATELDMLALFHEETGAKPKRFVGLNESKEFTHWLFKYRMKASDQAKIASDTRKGLDQLGRMRRAARTVVTIAV